MKQLRSKFSFSAPLFAVERGFKSHWANNGQKTIHRLAAGRNDRPRGGTVLLVDEDGSRNGAKFFRGISKDRGAFRISFPLTVVSCRARERRVPPVHPLSLEVTAPPLCPKFRCSIASCFRDCSPRARANSISQTTPRGSSIRSLSSGTNKIPASLAAELLSRPSLFCIVDVPANGSTETIV